MTEEKMQGEARQAFLVNTLQKLLGQDSPTGFTERVVTVAEEIARLKGISVEEVLTQTEINAKQVYQLRAVS